MSMAISIMKLNAIDINLFYKKKVVRSFNIQAHIIPFLLVLLAVGGALSLYYEHGRLSEQIEYKQLEVQKLESIIQIEDGRLQKQHTANPITEQFHRLPEELGTHYHPPSVVIDSLTKLFPAHIQLFNLSIKSYLMGSLQGTLDIQLDGSLKNLSDIEVFIQAINKSKQFELDQIVDISKVLLEDGSSSYAVAMKVIYHG